MKIANKSQVKNPQIIYKVSFKVLHYDSKNTKKPIKTEIASFPVYSSYYQLIKNQIQASFIIIHYGFNDQFGMKLKVDKTHNNQSLNHSSKTNKYFISQQKY